MSAKDFGVLADGLADDTKALQKALDYAARNDVGTIMLPAGKIRLTGDIIVAHQDNHSGSETAQITVMGHGAGKNATWLYFETGSLRVRSSSHMLRDFRVTSKNGDGIKIEPSSEPPQFSARGAMENIRAENCGGSGVTFEDCWCYRMDNCYARFNKGWGIEGKVGPLTGLSVNVLEISGGEYQGNGRIAGARTSKGGAGRGTGGGISTGRCVQFNLRGVTIEGNVGDGLKLAEQCRGLAVDGCYFEKNGSHPENRDICNDRPGQATHGPNSIVIVNCNFSPQNANGTVQERAIDLWDTIDLKIVHPQIFALSSGILYSSEPIRIRESVPARARGWIEGGWYSSAKYAQEWIANETQCFGFPRKQMFSPDVELKPGSESAASRNYFVRVPPTCARGVDVDLVTRPDGGVGTARLTRVLRRGPAGTRFSTTSFDIAHPSPLDSIYTSTSSVSEKMPGTHVEVQIVRESGHEKDTLPSSLFLQALEVTIYEGRISAG
ncbi:right-handed parallel beta-helix repeat-containing protein [Sphingopyxis macrogoltabida]|uniref:right-handed parallel beta-helix repeat-containing protein n=1 Tax=Sphingopyxis macrogoltabida TaxID=33050 RepID=UPI00214F34D4|nr:right-handed parallel beta-helix repeat-containing protein [Sphingopyxis macrogoltabida]